MQRTPRAGATKARKRSRARRLLVGAAWLGAGAVALLAILYGLRERMLAPLVIERASRYVEREYGLTLSVDSLGGDGYSEVRAGGVALHATSAAGVLRLARVDELAVRFHLVRLLAGRADWIERIDAHGAVVRLDLGARSAARGAAGGDAPAWPTTLPVLALTGLDLELRFAGGDVLAVRRAGVRSGPGDGGTSLALEVAGVELPARWPTSAHALRGRAELLYTPDELRVSELTLEGDLRARITGGRVALARLAQGETSFEADLEAFAGRAQVRGHVAHGAFDASYSTQDVELAEILRFAAPRLLEAPSARLTVEGEVLAQRGDFAASARGRAVDACVFGRALEVLDADVVFRPGVLDIAALDARQAENRVAGWNLRVPLDAEDGLETLRAARGSVEVELYDLPALLGEPREGVPPHRLQLAGALTDDGLELDGGRLVTRSGAFGVQRGRVTWSAPGEALLEHSRFDVDLAATFDDLGDLGPILGTARWSGSLRGLLHVSGTLRRPVGDIDLAGRDLVVAGFEVGSLTALANVDGSRLDVRTLKADGSRGSLELDGVYDFVQQRLEHVHCNAALAHLEDFVPGLVRAGSVALRAEVQGPLDEPTGSFSASARDLELVDGPTLAKLDVAGSSEGERLRIDALSALVADVALEASGVVQHTRWALPLSVDVDSAELARAGVSLKLAEAAHIEIASAGLRAENIELGGSAGRLRARVRTAGGDLALRVESDALEPMTVLAPWLPEGVELGGVAGSLELTRIARQLRANVDLHASRVQLAPDWPVASATLRGNLADGRAHIDVFEVRTEVGLTCALHGEFPFDLAQPGATPAGMVDAAAQLSIERLGELPWPALGFDGTCEGSLAASVTLAGYWPDVTGALECAGHGLRAIPRDPRSALATLTPDAVELELRALLDDDLTLERLALTAGESLHVLFEGRCLEGADVRALLARDDCSWRDMALDLRGSWSVPDVGFLAPLLAGVRRVEGGTSGEIALRGTWGAPEGHGALRWSRGALRLRQGLPPFEELEVVALFDGSRLRLERATGELGAGPFEIRGEVDFAGAEPHLDLALSGTELLFVQQRDARVRADAELALRGPLSALELSGELRTRDSRWTRDVDWFAPRGRSTRVAPAATQLFTLPSGPLSTLRFDVAVTAAEPLRIETNVARGALRPDLVLRGSGAEPQLSGALFLDPTRVFLPASTLELRSGTLTIDRRAPLDPALDLALAARVRGYDVTVRVSGSIAEPELELSSTPPLPAEDILLLLLTGRQPGGALSGDSGAQAAESVIVYFGKDLVSRWFGGGESLLERVEWQTGSDVTQAGGSTAQVQIRLSGRSDGEGRVIYLRGEKDVYDRINYGVRFVVRLR